MSNEISNERLEMISKYDTFVSLGEAEAMAKELLALRKCQHHWNTLRLVEAGGRYQYCTLCGAKKVVALESPC